MAVQCSASISILRRRIAVADGTHQFKVCTSNGQLLKICYGLQLGTNSVYNTIGHAEHNSTEEFLAAGENNETWTWTYAILQQVETMM